MLQEFKRRKAKCYSAALPFIPVACLVFGCRLPVGPFVHCSVSNLMHVGAAGAAGAAVLLSCCLLHARHHFHAVH